MSDKPVDSGKDGTYYDVELTNAYLTQGRHSTHNMNNAAGSIQFCLNDIIEVLDLNYAEANVIKAVWRIAAARKGKMKPGHNCLYDAEKAVFFSHRLEEHYVREKLKENKLKKQFPPAVLDTETGEVKVTTVDKTNTFTHCNVNGLSEEQLKTLTPEMHRAVKAATTIWRGRKPGYAFLCNVLSSTACTFNTRHFTFDEAKRAYAALREAIGDKLYYIALESEYVYCAMNSKRTSATVNQEVNP